MYFGLSVLRFCRVNHDIDTKVVKSEMKVILNEMRISLDKMRDTYKTYYICHNRINL